MEISPRRRRLRKIRGVVIQVGILCLIKVAVYFTGMERLSANALLSALVASTVFLLGFLLNGVLTDFKESEKIPGEIATALESLSLEVKAIPIYNSKAKIGDAATAIASLAEDLVYWFREDLSTEKFLLSYRRVHGEIVGAAAQFNGDASTLRGRLMQDMALIMQKVNRVRTLRETRFVPLVYWMADMASSLLFAGLVMTKSSNLPESVFFLAVISFLLILLLRLIDDIDNPFGQSDVDSAEDVSIYLLVDVADRLKAGLSQSPAE